MFNTTSDEEVFAFKRMHEYSTVDGFMEITECLAEMIKFAANEPSVGLFYIQQHTRNAVPNLTNLKNNVVEKSREMTLHTEDTEDSITMMRSMKDCGFPIVDEMIKDIKNSLSIMSSNEPKRGLISSSSWSPASWSRSTSYRENDLESSYEGSGYFSSVIKSAKQKASNFQWPQVESTPLNQVKGEIVADVIDPSAMPEAESEELPLSSQLADDPLEVLPVERGSLRHDLLSLSDNYQEFTAERKVKLEEWLGGMNNDDLHTPRSKE